MIVIEVAAGVLIAFVVRGAFLWWMENTSGFFTSAGKPSSRLSRWVQRVNQKPAPPFWSWRAWRALVLFYSILLLGSLIVVATGR
jgi:hypothetical protein